MFKLLQKVFGTRNDRILARLKKVIVKINALESKMKALTDDQLKAKTAEFKQRLDAGETLDKLLPEAFAVVREASVRTTKLRHFDVQLVGGIVLHKGKIAEMRTGEGKTLGATLPVYLNALVGKGVHVVTVNDYLAKRDAEWMEPIYEFLGLTVGINLPDMSPEEKRAAYAADVTYGTNNEFGFDYLRDNMAFELEGRVQRGLHYAIVDEVDSILIDEARTPLIISGPAEESSDLYHKINDIIPKLTKQLDESEPADYTVDEKTKQAFLTEIGHDKVEQLLVKGGLLTKGSSLYDPANIGLFFHLNAALRAHALYQLDVDYIVKNNQVIIVDEHTGRLMPGRRWSDGLHQAVEAKEGANIESENQTLATITFQNYFRLYEKLSGMTGTADTEATEFHQIYGLEVVIIPTNQPMIRQDEADQVYLTQQEKYHAIVNAIKERINKKQPILVGTCSIESSEYLSGLLKKDNIEHQVLNAKHHEREAKIVAEAGRPCSLTIATNMAGRGTDIVLGGNLEAELSELENPTQEKIDELTKHWQQRHEAVVSAGGLHVLGTERNESRRVDNQLRGRSGRQGDPGSSQFYLSLEDNLMRIFASDRVAALMKRLGMKENEVIESAMVTRAIENAQRKVEGHNFDIRKNLLEYDDVANDQRKVIYAQRNELMLADDISGAIEGVREYDIEKFIDAYIPPESMEDVWDISGLEERFEHDYGIKVPVSKWLEEEDQLHEENLRQRLLDKVAEQHAEKEQAVGEERMRFIEKAIMLQTLDQHWKDHLAAMDYLRQGIHLRGYAQKNPTQEYKRESFELFTSMLDNIKHDVISTLSVEDFTAAEGSSYESDMYELPAVEQMQFQHAQMSAMQPTTEMAEAMAEGEAAVPYTRAAPKVGRNQPCPCGSGKKYKQCHGRI